MSPLFEGLHHPVVVAHRGASHTAPENTIAALAAAVQSTPSLGGIEIDVQVSADGHAVLYHDEHLHRLGRPGARVEDLGVAEVTRLEIGGHRVPTLRSVLAQFLDQTRLLVEVKMYGDLEADPVLRCRRTDAILGELLELGKGAERLRVLCFDAQTLRLMHVQAPHLRYVLNLGGQLPDPSRLSEEIAAGHLSALCVDIQILQPEFVALVHGQGVPVLTYTCNRAAEVDHALACGADAILADDTAWLASYLETLPQPGLPTAS